MENTGKTPREKLHEIGELLGILAILNLSATAFLMVLLYCEPVRILLGIN